MRGLTFILAAAGAAALIATVTAGAQDRSGGGPGTAQVSAEGEKIYQEICQACHMADARGGAGAGASVPALAANSKLADPNYPITLLLKGRGGMPWFTDMLSHEQMAAVITYVRTHFGNNYPAPVTEADVNQAAATGEATREACSCN